MSTRIIVKQLPKHLTQNERLRAHFAAHVGAEQITDCKIVMAPHGVSRRFAYLGFRDAATARAAVAHFHRTFIDTSRIVVEEAVRLGDPALLKTVKSKYTRAKMLGDEAAARQRAGGAAGKKDENKEKEEEEDKDEREFQQFKALMKPRGATQTWANDESAAELLVDHIKQQDDDDEYQDLPQAGEKEGNEEATPAAAAAAPEPRAEPVADATSASPEAQIAESGSLFVRNLSYALASEESLRALFAAFGQLAAVDVPMVASSAAAAADDNNEKVENVSGVRSKGFATVTFMFPADAVRAWRELDGTIQHGRLLHILPARPASGASETAATESDDFRARKAAKLAASATNSDLWNSLYMDANAVARYVARATGSRKADLLLGDNNDNDTGGGVAVSLALAETHVIGETLRYFEEMGVDTELLLKPRPKAGDRKGKGPAEARDEAALLVKGLPAEFADAELRALFARVAPLRALIVPPTRSMAIVHFAGGSAHEAQEHGRRALRELAYRNFNGLPLKLEFARAGLLSGTTTEKAAIDETEETRSEPRRDEAQGAELPQTSSLFVKNLSFGTSEAGLLAFARDLLGDSVRKVKVQTRFDERRKRTLSAGFGFVELASQADTLRARDALDGKTLDGHKLQAQFLNVDRSSGKPAVETETSKEEEEEEVEDVDGHSGEAKPTKILVKNVAFETKPREVRALFANFGTLRSVRMPQKGDRSHRGFAFVRFATHAEAARAMREMRGTHLFGRRLVMEFAQDNDEDDEDDENENEKETDASQNKAAQKLERLREKTKRKFRDESELTHRVVHRKVKLDDDDGEDAE